MPQTPIYCATCGIPLPAKTPQAGEWVSKDGKQRIPLYYCGFACLFRHIAAPVTMKTAARQNNGKE